MGDRVVNKNKGDVVDDVYLVLRNSDGLTITEIVEKTNLSRSAIRTALAKLDGANKVSIRQIGMAKVYNGKKKK